MERKPVSGIMLTMLLIGLLALAFNVQTVEASGTIYIRADGAVEGTDKIQRDGDVYIFTDHIYDEIVVERSNIIVDGNRYALNGSGSGYGFYVIYENNVTIKNANIKGFESGIYLKSTSNNTISKNNITTNNRYGMYIFNSSRNTISGNEITANNDDGIHLYKSLSNTISGNTVYSNNRYGIWVGWSDNNTLFNNNMTDNTYNFGLGGHLASNYENSVDVTNTVNGKPIYYLRNVSNTVYDAQTNGGIFYLINCNNITIKDMTLVNNGHGVRLWNTTNSKIENLIISNNSVGISLRYSGNNIIEGNTITSNAASGIHFVESSHNNVVEGNTILNNWWGIFLYRGTNSTIVSGNTICARARAHFLCGYRRICHCFKLY